MKARDLVNRQFSRSLSYPRHIAFQVLLLLFIVSQVWAAFQQAEILPLIPEPFSVPLQLAVLAVLVLVIFSPQKGPVTCPFCKSPLVLDPRLYKLPKDYYFCPTCGGDLEKEVCDDNKA